MDDYDGYNAGEEDIIDYNADDYDLLGDDNCGGINLEDMFISAESSSSPIEEYNQIIELEKDNSSECKWSYKAYEKLSLLFISKKDFPQFSGSFSHLFELYPKVDDADKQDTIRTCTFYLHDGDDTEFIIQTLRFMLDLLMEKEIDRAVMDTGLQFAKALFKLSKYPELGSLLDELLQYMEKLDANDEIYKSIKLELLVMKIQFCNIIKDKKNSKRLYLQAYKLNHDQIIHDTRLSAVINEEGGKLHLMQKDYEAALEKFKSAFYDYQQGGNIRAKTLLKYAILASIIARNSKNIVSPEEARPYLNDEMLKAMLELQTAYEEMDIRKINRIWNEKIVGKELDGFIIENLNEILHNIRFNYIMGKLKAYRKCSFNTLEQISLTEKKAKLNLIENYIEMEEKNEVRENTLRNFEQWMNILSSQ